jgi:hypothetical protein
VVGGSGGTLKHISQDTHVSCLLSTACSVPNVCVQDVNVNIRTSNVALKCDSRVEGLK